MRPGFPASVAIVAAAAAALAAAPRAQTPFRSSVDLVRLPVVVTGKGGLLVRGLKAADFQVLEDGRPQTIGAFAEGAPGDPLPLHLGLLLDTSESMGDDLSGASDAVVRFINALDEAVDATFVDFDTDIRVGRFSPSSYPTLFERIRGRKASGATALYDALGVYLESALRRDGQHVLLLYTDGGDTTSSLTFGRLQKLLRLGNVIVYAIGYLEHQSRNDQLVQQMRVSQIARETGGEAFFPTSQEEIHEIYAKILDEIGSRYTIGYVSANTAADGRFRKVEVRLTNPDLKNAKIRTRSGYIAPVG